MTAIALDRMTAADLPAVLALLEQAELPTSGVRENVSRFFVAKLNGRVVASAGIESYGSSGLLRSVTVERAHRRERIGTALVQHAIQLAAREGLTGLYLLTTKAEDYFERFGFRPCPRGEAPAGVRESWEFRTGCPDSAVFMIRQLGVGGQAERNDRGPPVRV